MNYEGNPDFRGFLAANAPQHLAYTGNDGGINTTDLQNYILGSGALQDQQPSMYQGAQNEVASLYSQWQAAQNGNTVPGANTASGVDTEAIRRNLAVSQSGAEAGARQSVTDTAAGYDSASSDFLSKIRTGQEDINTGRTNNALGLRRTISNIANGIRQGLRSGGVTLANMNASDSGAAEAMARAYADTGNAQWMDANNQAELKNQELETGQVRLNRDKEEGLRRLSEYVPRETGRIRGDLFNKLQVLDTQAQNSGVAGAVDMGIVERVIAEAIAQLSQVDARRNAGLGEVRGLTADEINQKAAQMDIAGMNGVSPFAIPEGASLSMAGGGQGAPISQLPIFVKRRQA